MEFISIGKGARNALRLWKLSKKSRQCEAFGTSVHDCWQTLMGSHRMEDGRILLKISAHLPLINTFGVTPLSVRFSLDRSLTAASENLYLSEENDDQIQS